ncbi:hypothetical protein T02_2973 [Trichinella nativa]|uniref:Uncharacterized protein n=1 Tax=Trichinella nativa TaxID=6335 RepID=A0A0V1L5D0_9BILA|nr:hypothetical protein T02_2973 [Trichinella nativa]
MCLNWIFRLRNSLYLHSHPHRSRRKDWDILRDIHSAGKIVPCSPNHEDRRYFCGNSRMLVESRNRTVLPPFHPNKGNSSKQTSHFAFYLKLIK